MLVLAWVLLLMGEYRTIVADPPWEYEGFASDPTSGRGLPETQRRPPQIEALPYQAMSLGELAEIPMSTWTHPDGCRLFCWATNRYLLDAGELLKAWGFRYVQALVWRKTGNPSPFGGSVAPNHGEFLLIGITGKIPVSSRIASSVIEAPAQRQHSRKPEAFLDLVESISPGPYLELFARRNRLGWDTWGNESLHHVELST